MDMANWFQTLDKDVCIFYSANTLPTILPSAMGK